MGRAGISKRSIRSHCWSIAEV